MFTSRRPALLLFLLLILLKVSSVYSPPPRKPPLTFALLHRNARNSSDGEYTLVCTCICVLNACVSEDVSINLKGHSTQN